jgi:hypothetical protein
MATWEEARVCPKCGNAGHEDGRLPTKKPGVTAVKLTCENPLCKWYDTPWFVQINKDGSIPDAMSALGPKQFVIPKTEAEANALIKAANEQGEAAYRITHGELGGR